MSQLIAYAAARVLIFLVTLPPLRLGLALGRCFGGVAFHLLRIRRNVVEGNLHYVLGDRYSHRELRALAREAYDQFAMNLVEVMRAVDGKTHDLEKRVEIPDFAQFEALHKAGKPLIVCSPHSGNFDLMGQAAAARGIETYVLMRPFNHRRVQNYIVRGRERLGMHVLQRGKDSFAKMFDLLEAGKTVALLPDLNARKFRVMVDFLGRPAQTFQGPAVLHLVTGAQLVVAVDRRKPGDLTRHEVHLRFLPIHEPTGNRKQDIQAITQAICDAMSEEILEVPGQYFWFHRRWGKERFRSPSVQPDEPAALAKAPATSHGH